MRAHVGNVIDRSTTRMVCGQPKTRNQRGGAIDGPCIGFRTMTPIEPLINAAAGTRCEALQTATLDVYEVEVVDPVGRTAKHVRWIRRQEAVGIR